MSDIARLTEALADRYRIDREIGAGGMATVYLARDLKHDRQVALKVLKPELGAVLGVERFLSEIKVTANLQHPNLLPLFDSGEAAGLLFYVMPYVEGESLRARLDREKQLPMDEAIRLAVAVASALSYAHERGVIHRDLKPENILIQAGQPVIADFGIALAVSNAGGARVTQTGLSLGTPQYMSPEQAAGDRTIDGRSDIYSLAAVTYEMIGGEPPHSGTSAQAIIAKLMSAAPQPLSALRSTAPQHVVAAVNMALAKLPADRFATAAAFADALQRPGTLAYTAAETAAERKRTRFAVAGWAAGAIAVLALAGGFFAGRRSAPEAPARLVQFATDQPDSVTSNSRCCGRALALSPDGLTLVFVGTKSGGAGALYRRSLGRLDAERIPGTEGGATPFFSPDGRWVGFAADGKLRKVSLSGGPAVPIIAADQVSLASWGDGDVIVYAEKKRLWTVPAGGGKARALTSPDSSTAHLYPFMLPGGRSALVSIRVSGSSLESSRIGIVQLESGKVDTIGFGTRAEYASGYLVFAGADNTLMAQPFDAGRGKVTGPAVAIVARVKLAGSTNHEFTVSASGALAFSPAGGLEGETFRIASLGGARTLLPLPGRNNVNLEDPAISPDGRLILFRIATNSSVGLERSETSGQPDLWLLNRQQGTVERFTVGGGAAPVWSPDGKRVAYTVGDSGNVGPAGIYVRAADQTGAPQLVLKGKTLFAGSWTPDGRTLVFQSTGRANTKSDIGAITIGDSVARWLVASEFSEVHPQLSPGGRWLAYASDRTGRSEVYVQPMTGPGGASQVSTEGGNSPRWSSDGHTLYYVVGTSISAAALAPGAGFGVVSRKVVVDGGVTDINQQNVNWDIFPSGKEVLYIDQQGQGSARIVWTLDWTELVRGMTTGK